MNALIVRALFVIAVVLILIAAGAPLSPALGSLVSAADALTRRDEGGRAAPHVVGFEKANAALTGHEDSGGMPTPEVQAPVTAPPKITGILDALFSDAPQTGKRRRLHELADRARGEPPPDLPRFSAE